MAITLAEAAKSFLKCWSIAISDNTKRQKSNARAEVSKAVVESLEMAT